MSYFFHPAAEAEYLESIAYYESKRSGLGATYLGEFERRPDVRRMRMERFPFTVLYRENANTVQVLAVAHNRRRPQYWLGRF